MKSQIYLAECLEKFYELPELVILEFDNPVYLQIIKDLNNKYGLELSFLVILVAVSELTPEDMPEYLAKRYDLPDETAQGLAQQLNELYFQPIIKRLAFFNQDSNKIKPSPEEEKNIIIDLFKENLLVEIKNYEQVISAINQRVFAWLDRDPSAKQQIENAFLQNQEIITQQAITINNEELPGTTANWLHCFAVEKGTDSLNSLSVSEFLGLSKNTNELSAEDKKIIRALLNIYRNIKFFPESMPSDDGTDWAIIPLPEKELSLEQQATDKIQTEQFIDPEMQPVKAKPEPELLSTDPDTINKINQLKLMLGRYGANSLEGQAILEEITKLQRN
jgi:hypothetical protein